MNNVLKRVLLPVIYVILISAVLLPLQLAAPVNAQEGESECWAVIVGVSDYQYLSDTPYADDDARDLADQLSPVWGSDHINLLIDSDATKENIRSAITSWLASRADANDVVIFYYSWFRNDTMGFIYPYEAFGTSNTFISADELNIWLGGLDSEKIVIINVGPEKHTDILAGPGRIILAPNEPGEDSWATRDLGHSVFTHYIIEALEEFKTGNSNNNYELSIQEIFDYARTRTINYSTTYSGITIQHPQISDGCIGDVNVLIKVTADVDIDTSTAPNILNIDGQSYSPSDLPETFIWAPGSQHNLQTTSTISGATGTRYVFNSWNDGNNNNSRTISSGGAYTADYTTQYYLTVESEYGNPQGEGWYDSGASAQISVNTPVEQGGTKRIFTEWGGDHSGTSASSYVTMDKPKTVTASWKTQYYLTLNSVHGSPTGAGWYDSGTTAAISVNSLVEETGTKHHFSGWSGDHSGTSASSSVVMNQPRTVTADWTTEYYLTVESEYGEPQGEGWYDSGATATISVSTPVGMIVRQAFTEWTGDYTGDEASGSVVMNKPKTVTAEWTTDLLQLYILIIIVVVVLGGLGGFWFMKTRKPKAPAPASSETPSAPSPMRCANCGAEISPEDKFCIKCGKSVNDK